MIENIIDIFRLELLLQLGLATLLGGAIGLERELGGKPAGLRTNILICIGSALYTQLSLAMVPAGRNKSRAKTRNMIAICATSALVLIVIGHLLAAHGPR